MNLKFLRMVKIYITKKDKKTTALTILSEVALGDLLSGRNLLKQPIPIQTLEFQFWIIVLIDCQSTMYNIYIIISNVNKASP